MEVSVIHYEIENQAAESAVDGFSPFNLKALLLDEVGKDLMSVTSRVSACHSYKKKSFTHCSSYFSSGCACRSKLTSLNAASRRAIVSSIFSRISGLQIPDVARKGKSASVGRHASSGGAAAV